MKSARPQLVSTLAAALIGCGAAAPPAGSSQQGLGAGASGRYVVVFRSGTLPADAGQRVARAGGAVLKALPDVGVLTAAGPAAFAAGLAADGAVLAVGPEHRYEAPRAAARASAVGLAPAGTGAPTAADDLYALQWDLRRVGAPAVWARLPLPTQRRSTVAVLDVGVMDDHPDLQGQIVASFGTNYCRETGGPGATAGYPIYSRLIDFVANPSWDPSQGCTAAPVTYEDHGTHVSGTVAARFGGGRVVGVAPGVGVAAYKVFDRYRIPGPGGEVIEGVGGFDGPIFQAIVDAASRGYGVINMSLGGALDRSKSEDNASWLAWDRVAKYANRKGTLIVASAGNDGERSQGTLAHVPSDLPTVVSVSATGASDLQPAAGLLTAQPGSDVLAFYSNYGSAIDLSAPGGDCGVQPSGVTWCALPQENRPATWFLHLILSSIILPDGQPGYAFFAGTSMASPHVAAVAALVRALHGAWDPGQVRDYLKATAQPLAPHQLFGAGLVDADAAAR